MYPLQSHKTVTAFQVDDLQTEDECMSSYFRMYYNNGQMNSLYSCGISYDDYRYFNYSTRYND